MIASECRVMKRILIIGIGAGDPEYVTMQAVNALNEADVFFIMDKGPAKAKLTELRKEICRRYIRGNDHRFVDATSPAWARDTEDYLATVDSLNRAGDQMAARRLIAAGTSPSPDQIRDMSFDFKSLLKPATGAGI